MPDNPPSLEIVPGKNDREEHVFSVIVKRSYTIEQDGTVARRRPDHPLRRTDLYFDGGDPGSATMLHEHELAPFKASVDVVVIGKAYAPEGRPVPSMPVSVRIGNREKRLVVFGDRACRFRTNALPEVSPPQPFTELELRYERAYGGRDETSLPDIPFHYPRNPMGWGIALRNLPESIDGLRLPNIEDPDDLLTPDRIVLAAPDRWHEQPLPQGFGWRQREWYPRSALLGAYPPLLDVGTVTREEAAGLLPGNHIALAKQLRLPTLDARFNNGASHGLIFQTLEGNERVTLSGLSPTGPLSFALPGERPRIALDLGEGAEPLESRLHTVSIRPDDREFDLIWRGARRYEGYHWLPRLRRLRAEVN